MKAGNRFSDDWRIRVIGGKIDFVGIVDFILAQLRLDFLFEPIVRPDHSPTLVGGHEVEYGEKGFFRLGIQAPMCFG